MSLNKLFLSLVLFLSVPFVLGKMIYVPTIDECFTYERYYTDAYGNTNVTECLGRSRPSRLSDCSRLPKELSYYEDKLRECYAYTEVHLGVSDACNSLPLNESYKLDCHDSVQRGEEWEREQFFFERIIPLSVVLSGILTILMGVVAIYRWKNGKSFWWYATLAAIFAILFVSSYFFLISQLMILY